MALTLVFLLTVPTIAQRKGNSETGGYIMFSSYNEADKKNYGQLFLQNWIGYYISRSVGVDIEPALNIGFHPDSISVTLLMLASMRFRLFDMTPSGWRKIDYLRRDYGISSSLFAHIGFGYWSDGYSLTEGISESRSGPALMLGVGTQSRFGRWSTMRIKLQWVEMFSTSGSGGKGRSLILVGVGFGVFIRS